jgi:phycobilisome rod-core linker protein
MAIPLLQYAPSTQNQRVTGFDVASDDLPRIFSTDNILSNTDMSDLINAAYRQIFFHAFASDRQSALESQLRNGQLTVRDFIRGLLLSKTYIESFYNKNSNYRFVEQTVQRVLGRDVYSNQEKIAWSIVIATKGVAAFADQLLNSDEYLDAFGYNTVPYQRRRVLASRAEGEIPFNIKSPRYDEYYRAQIGFPQVVWQATARTYVAASTKVGDPSGFLNMARSIKPAIKGPQRISALNINIDASVPRR